MNTKIESTVNAYESVIGLPLDYSQRVNVRTNYMNALQQEMFNLVRANDDDSADALYWAIKSVGVDDSRSIELARTACTERVAEGSGKARKLATLRGGSLR